MQYIHKTEELLASGRTVCHVMAVACPDDTMRLGAKVLIIEDGAVERTRSTRLLMNC